MLAWTIYLSFTGLLALMLLPRANARAARIVALLAAGAGFLRDLGLGAEGIRGDGAGALFVRWRRDGRGRPDRRLACHGRHRRESGGGPRLRCAARAPGRVLPGHPAGLRYLRWR